MSSELSMDEKIAMLRNTPGVPHTNGLDRGPITPGLDGGPQTPGLDKGPQTPGLDSAPKIQRVIYELKTNTTRVRGHSRTMEFAADGVPSNDKSGGAPFAFKSAKQSNDVYLVTIHPGRIRDVITTDTNAVIFYDPELDGDTLFDDPSPEFQMTYGDFLYVSYSTDKKGNIKSDPVAGFFISNGEEPSVHYQPTDELGSGGADGDYKVKIGQITGSTPADFKWVSYQNSDIEHYHELPTFLNLSGGAGIFKERVASEDTYKFRGITGNYGIDTYVQDGTEVYVDFSAQSVGDGEEVYITPEDTLPEPPAAISVKFRTIRGLGSEPTTEEGVSFTPQIRVATAVNNGADPLGDKNTIEVSGNRVVSSVVFVSDDEEETVLGEVAWQDGLVVTGNTEEGDSQKIVIPSSVSSIGRNLDITVFALDLPNNATGSAVGYLHFRKGLYIGNSSDTDIDVSHDGPLDVAEIYGQTLTTGI